MCFSQTIKGQVADAVPTVEMTSSVSAANEVASFVCSSCDNEWLSRPRTVIEQGCPSCIRFDTSMEEQITLALLSRRQHYA